LLRSSPEDAVTKGVARVSDLLHDITVARVKDHSVVVAKDKVTEGRVTMKVTFILKVAAPAKAKK
jgi:flavin-binding protein dodecin